MKGLCFSLKSDEDGSTIGFLPRGDKYLIINNDFVETIHCI